MPKVGMQPIRRQQLIDATLEAINELGLAEASISQIAKRAGVSTGIISHYFKDKHGLIFATMQYLLAQLETAVAQALSQTEASPKARLMAIVRGNFSPSQINQAAMKTGWLFGRLAYINRIYMNYSKSMSNGCIPALNTNFASVWMKNRPKMQLSDLLH